MTADTQNYAETVPLHKISTPGNKVKLRDFLQCDNMSNIHVSSDVLSTLMLLKQNHLYKLQQQILHDISGSSLSEMLCDEATLKTYTAPIGKHLFKVFLVRIFPHSG